MEGGTDWLSSRVHSVAEPRRSLRQASAANHGAAGAPQRTSARRPITPRSAAAARRSQGCASPESPLPAAALRCSGAGESQEGESPPPAQLDAAQALLAGITQAAAAMAMHSPHPAAPKLPQVSPVSVLMGPDMMSPLELRSPAEAADSPVAFANPGQAADTSSTHDMEGWYSQPRPRAQPQPQPQRQGGSRAEAVRLARSSSSSSSSGQWGVARPPLLSMAPIRRRGQRPEEAAAGRDQPLGRRPEVAGWEGREAEAEAEAEALLRRAAVQQWEASLGGADPEGGLRCREGEEEEMPESPTTPSTSTSPVQLPCPEAPQARSKEMMRSSSLTDTKLLVTTHLKRSFSVFQFEKHFDFLRIIGQGSSSIVYEARDQRGGALCAVKKSTQRIRGREDREHYLHELQSVEALAEHPHVVRYYRGWQQGGYFYSQMELCEGGSLRTLLDTREGPLPEEQIWKFVRQVASGLQHIHEAGVLHLDIKPDNIFLDSQGDLKIGDFGEAVLAKEWQWEEGDGAYLAPELLREQEPGPPADMYSFGAMLYEWAAATQLPRSGPAREGQISLPAGRSSTLTDLVRQLLDPDPARRPTAARVVAWPSEG